MGAAKAEPYVPPPDPDFERLAYEGYYAWQRDKPRLVAFDTETHGLAFHDRPFCLTAAWHDRRGQIVGHYFELDRFDSLPLLTEMFGWNEPGEFALVGHNLKFDLQKSLLVSIICNEEFRRYQLHDTEALAHLENEHQDKGLKDLMVQRLSWEYVEEEIKSGHKKGQMRRVPKEKAALEFVRRKLKLKKDDPWSLLPRAVILPYAVKDAEATLALYTLLRPLVERYDDLWALYEQEMELTLVLLDMETAGMRLDLEYVFAQVKEFNRRLLQRYKEIEEIVGKSVRTGTIPKKEREEFFNPSSSSPDTKAFLTAAGFERDSYDADNLKLIDHPLARIILDLRKDETLLTRYFLAMKDEQRDGILNPNFRQHGTVTGRMSSGKQEG